MTDKEIFDGELFLEKVTEQLRIKIKELEEALNEGQKEIRDMHDYYWENYAEMDQYGYEDYDNRQALLHQINANNEKMELYRRLKKMLDGPFFGRVDFVYEGEEEIEPFYIGIGNFAPGAGMTPWIYDWRVPVSSLFYDYDKGPASYEAPAGKITGEILSKWQYKITGGRMVYAFENDTKIDDDILKQELGNSGDIKLKNIVSTIQKEQNSIIRNTKDKIMVIQGAAGSGKTSVALHRIAYLLYHDRENLKSSDILILSPNSVFSDYISHILPELGEENIQEMSFDLFAYRELKETVADCEDRYDYLEKMMKFNDADQQKIFQEKQSAAFIGQMEGFLAVLEDQLMDFRPVEYRGMEKTAEEIIKLFYFRFQNLPLLMRMDAIMEYFADEYETLHGRDMTEEERDYIRQKFNQMYETTDLYTIYNQMLTEGGYDPLPETEYDRRVLGYEDVFPMLYLKYRLKGTARHRQVKHLVIDEMQDYTYLQYTILNHLFSCRMTILGDRAQTLDQQIQDVLCFLPKIFGKGIRKIIMDKSYRNTLEIARYAEKITGVTGISYLERHGKAVEERQFKTDEEIMKDIREVYQRTAGVYETSAVLTMTQEEAFDISRLLKNIGLQVNYIDKNSSSFKKGLTVTTYYLAKGLEFDQVFCVMLNQSNPMLKQARYICATRALHELYMYQLFDGD